MRQDEFLIIFKVDMKSITKYAFNQEDAIILAKADRITDGLDHEIYSVKRL